MTAAVPRTSSGALELLADRTFRQVWLAGALLGIQRWLELLAIGIYVFDRTGSPFQVALMTMLRILPMALLSAFAGALADRVSRRLLLQISIVGMTAVSGGLGLLALTGAIELWHIALGALLGGVFWATDLPVRRTLLGEIAGSDRLGAGMGLDAATNNATRMLGPVLGGFLLQLIGLDGSFFVGAALFAVSFLLLARVDFAETHAVGIGRNVLRNILEGLQYLRTDRALVGTLAVTVIFNIWGFPFTSMVPVIGRDIMNLEAGAVGLLMSAEGAGALIGALAIAFRARQAHYRRIYFYGTFAFLALVLVFGATGLPAVSATVLLAIGVAGACFSSMQSTITLLSAPPAIRGRIMGVVSVCIGTGVLGFLYIGLLADWLGAPLAVMLTAAQGLVAMVLVGLIWPELRR